MAEHQFAAMGFNDFAGVTRVRTCPAERAAKALEAGLAWIPGNMCLTTFGNIAAGNPAGATGELRMMPDAETRIEVPLPGETTSPLLMYLCNMHAPDGAPWDGCPRNFLRRAVARLREDFGLHLRVAFEHEFSFLNPAQDIVHGFSLQAARKVDAVSRDWLAALDHAEIPVELLMPEYGMGQFEIVVPPADAMAAADQAVLVKDLIREVARCHGDPVSFSPKPSPEGPGNGVHVHFSIYDENNRPLMAGDRDDTISAEVGPFVSGVLAHLQALCGLGATTVPSYMRLQPNSWAASKPVLGFRDREAALRLCPGTASDPTARRNQVNIELRTLDATANPYVILGALIHAGIDGMHRRLEGPDVHQANPEPSGKDTTMPDSVHTALQSIDDDEVIRAVLPEDLRASFLAVKNDELRTCTDLEPAGICRAYATAV